MLEEYAYGEFPIIDEWDIIAIFISDADLETLETCESIFTVVVTSCCGGGHVLYIGVRVCSLYLRNEHDISATTIIVKLVSAETCTDMEFVVGG